MWQIKLTALTTGRKDCAGFLLIATKLVIYFLVLLIPERMEHLCFGLLTY